MKKKLQGIRSETFKTRLYIWLKMAPNEPKVDNCVVRMAAENNNIVK